MILRAENLVKTYKGRSVVKGISVEVNQGEIVGLLGPNGAGKTTTIKMLTCLVQATSGTANVAGYDMSKNPNEVREKIGMAYYLSARPTFIGYTAFCR